MRVTNTTNNKETTMNCYRCQTENEPGAHYCRQCGADLWVSPEQKDDGSRKGLMYVLIVMGWDYFTYLIWLVIPKLVTMTASRNLSGFTNGTRITSIFSVIRWSTGTISLLLMIVFAILCTNIRARVCLIVFAAIRLFLLLYYQFQ